jgi:hypothetical protein
MELTALEHDRLRFATHPVSRALALSLALHLLLFGTLELTRYLRLQLPEWLKSVLDLSRQASQEKKPVDQEPPTLTFVEVDPAQATPDPPKDTKNYSAFNSLAANPEVSIDSEKPKIDGTQDKVPKVEDALRPTPPQPLTELKPEPRPPKAEPKPDQPGDLALAKPADTKPAEAEKPPRPRTLAEVRSRENLILGKKMKEDGGVERHGRISAFDAQGTLTGNYDWALVAAVQQCWYNILDETMTPTPPGKVVVEFRLHSDGYVTDVRILETNVGEIQSLFCQRAIEKPAPFARWPEGMQRELGKNNRLVKFAFYYE